MTPPVLRVTPIGTLHTPFADRASAPRQPAAARGAHGTIELFPDGRYEHALADIETFPLIWVLFWFHLNEGWRGKVLPPRSTTRRGVFATRSPYRPNPIGLSVLRLERVEGLVLHVLDVDMIDGTPVIDIKPYLPYTDAVATTSHGWLDEEQSATAAGAATESPADPKPAYDVRIEPLALRQMDYLSEHGVELAARVRDMLGAGPSPHPYRRIRKTADGFRLAVREWRVVFSVKGSIVTVERVHTGYRPSVLYDPGKSPEGDDPGKSPEGDDPGKSPEGDAPDEPDLDLHRRYVERFGLDGDRG